MNTKLENKFSMFNTVKSVEKQNLVAVDSVPAVKSSFLKFFDKCDQIETVIKLQIKSIKGYSQVKNDALKSLCESGNEIASALFAYGSSVNNILIKDSSNFSLTDFIRMRDSVLVETCRNLYKLASDNIAILGPYNIDAAYLLAFSNLIDQTANVNPAPTVERSHRKVYTRQLNDLFKEAMQILNEEVDKTMLLLKKSYPDFYKHYKNARIIIDLKGKRKNSQKEEPVKNATLQGFVYDEIDNSPIEDAVVEIPALDITVITDEDGEYYFEEVPSGNHIVKVSAATFNQKEIADVKIAEKEQISLDIYITPSDLPSNTDTPIEPE